MNLSFFCALLLLVAGEPAKAAGPVLLELKSEIEQALTSQLNNESLGISYAIVDANGNSLTGAVGARETTANGTPVPMLSTDLHRVASISKLFTSIAIFQLKERGKLALSGDVMNLIPRLQLGDEFDVHPNWKAITVQHLLTHTAGISRNVPLGDFTTGGYWPDAGEYTTALRGVNSEFRPGEYFKYSNAGFMILGRIIGQLTSGNWESGCNFHVEKSILAPLGMNASGFNYAPAELSLFARAHSFPQASDALSDPDWIPSLKRYVIPAYASVGGRACDDGLATSADDMSRFLAALLRPFYGQDSRLGISEDTFWQMLTPQVRIGGRGQAFGFYWTNSEHFGHSGYYSGFRSILSVFPSDGFAIFLSRNSSEAEPAVAPLRSILRRHLPKPRLSESAENFLQESLPGGSPIQAPTVAPVRSVSYLAREQAAEFNGLVFVSKVIGTAKPVLRERGPNQYELTLLTEGLGTIPLLYSGIPDLFYVGGGSMIGEKVFIERGPSAEIKSIFVNSYLRYHRR